jgi:hypothetical protein
MTDLDSMIAKAHGAAEATENQARQLEARICKIPGAARLLPVRRYGADLNPADIRKNLTLSSLIARHDHQLAAYLGVATGEHRRSEEEQQARILQAERMRLQTEQARAQNQAAATDRYRRQLTPLPQGWRAGR